MIEVKINENVNKKVIKETLSRMGVANRKEMILYPSCYLYERDGKTFICHFKELFEIIANGFNNMTESDHKRKRSVIRCLVDWGLVSLLSDAEEYDLDAESEFVFVVPHKEKYRWKIWHKFRMPNED